jgi:hypothetical protein
MSSRWVRSGHCHEKCTHLMKLSLVGAGVGDMDGDGDGDAEAVTATVGAVVALVDALTVDDTVPASLDDTSTRMEPHEPL